MLVTIASLQQPTFHSEFSLPRKPGQYMTEYVSQELYRRMQYVSGKLEVAAKAAIDQRPDSECLFFTLPEFFWNVPWSSAQHEDDLLEHGMACMDRMPECMEVLMNGLPVDRYGKVVLLAGTCATLIKVGEGADAYFDVINYVMTTSNFKVLNDGSPEMSMWPKRYVSGIDFGKYVDSADGYWFFKLSDNVTIKVKDVSSTVAEHNSANGYGAVFSNTLIAQCPFSINVCLDYAVLENGQRDEELEKIDSKIDFLIACGMSFEDGKRYPDSVGFAVRNDGMGAGSCQFAEVKAGRITHLVPSVIVEDSLHFATLDLS
ncbi:hypothetical protein [Pseudomonas frederiksbergensis]|uniref:Uncharacterized protein n=1 Tax=Pseudomonas frederiksbergensis TaxID=104087 RepID=A0A6L5BTR2_9PSED|nr:hypothetical protein [Pseudomonas frederiksbergensis]KAF2390847.1 hypothetical protein FX983_05319 [Pseudomonas frederiksbergensis]